MSEIGYHKKVFQFTKYLIIIDILINTGQEDWEQKRVLRDLRPGVDYWLVDDDDDDDLRFNHVYCLFNNKQCFVGLVWFSCLMNSYF